MAGLIPFNRNRQIRPTTFGSFYDMLDDFFSDSWLNDRSLTATTFKVDVKEDEKEYLINAELPGVSKEEISLDFNDGRLTINVSKNEEKSDNTKNYIHREIRTSSMQRSIYLNNASNEGIGARLDNGILKITVQKEEKISNNRKIEIE